jgi:hypothetical protein
MTRDEELLNEIIQQNRTHLWAAYALGFMLGIIACGLIHLWPF